jgi:hypothetical protein
MRKEQAQSEIKKHEGLLGLELQHSVYNKKMKLVKLDVCETHPGSGNYFVSCELNGHLGHFRETLDYVVKNYVSTQTG